MKKAIGIYVKPSVDLTKYGFEKTQRGHWMWRTGAINGGLYVDANTLQLTPYLGFCTRTIAVIIKMAEDKALDVDDPDDVSKRRYTMRLTYDEMCAVERLRGHPEKITTADVKGKDVDGSSDQESTADDVKTDGALE